VAAGSDPGESKKHAKTSAQEAEAARRADTVDKHAAQHLARCSGAVSESHWKQARLALADACHSWHGRAVGSITRRDVRELAEEITKARGPIAGNRAFQHLRKFFNSLVEHDVIASSPVAGLRRPTREEPSRDRVLSEDEIRSLWAALDSVGGPVCAAIRVLLLTGQRRSEVARMSWSEIDGNTWVLAAPRTKNGRPHRIPLSPQALAVIEQQPKHSDYVFAASRKPVADFARIKKAIDAVMKPETAWTVHDLRRTAASGLQRLGVRAEAIERGLNHVSGVYRSVAGIYQRDPLIEEVRDALARWGDYVERIVMGAEPGKVVQLRG
jgi:integrase